MHPKHPASGAMDVSNDAAGNVHTRDGDGDGGDNDEFNSIADGCANRHELFRPFAD